MSALCQNQTFRHSFDHLVGGGEQRVGDVEAERLCGLQVDVHLDLSYLLDRQVGGLVALENPAGIVTGRAVRFEERRPSGRRPGDEGHFKTPCPKAGPPPNAGRGSIPAQLPALRWPAKSRGRPCVRCAGRCGAPASLGPGPACGSLLPINAPY